ncbi:EamA family transporter [Patescibacteria group bacterium]|nr:EamA family transporter [Patescibacteria group bacterium]
MKELILVFLIPVLWATGSTLLSKTHSPIGIGFVYLLAAISIFINFYFISPAVQRVLPTSKDYIYIGIGGILYGVAGVLFMTKIGGAKDAGYWIAITAAVLPAVAMLIGVGLKEHFTPGQWMGLCICVFGILLMGKVIRL